MKNESIKVRNMENKMKRIKRCKKCGSGRLITSNVKGQKLTFCGFCGHEF